MTGSSGGASDQGSDQNNDWYEKVKFGLLALSFSFVVAAYTIAKELKDSIFINIVGREYLAKAKLTVVFVLIPAVFLYSYLVDKFRRYQLLSFYCYLYGISLFACAVLLGSSSIGLYNTDTSPWRLYGWLFYFLLEGFSPFIVGVFWAFMNSIANPKEAKNYYGLIVAGSKLGGMTGALFSWYLLSNLSMLAWFGISSNDVVAHQFLLGTVAVLLLFVPVIVKFMMKSVPGHLLHGYEAVYQAEKAKGKEGAQKTGIISGLKMLVKSPYILGVFSLVLFYESLNVVLNFQRLALLQGQSKSIAGFTASLFLQRFWMHFFGFILSIIGAKVLMKRLGERACLLVVPALISCLLVYFLVVQTPQSILYVFIGLGSINYSLSHPLRASLYIPTMKDVKFKAKSWIDTFGTKLSKASGSIFADVVKYIIPGTSAFFLVYGSFFAVLMGLWFSVSYLLGRKYESAVSNNEIIQ